MLYKSMELKKLLVVLCLILLSSVEFLVSEDVTEDKYAEIIVNVSGFRNTDGYLAALLFDSPYGFPENPEKASAVYLSEIQSSTHSLSFTDVRFGTYAVSVIHDEDKSGSLDLHWLGFPKEGVGSSGPKRHLSRAPEFDNSVFLVKESTVTLNIEIQYFGRQR